jgi:hypothetical protein
MPRQPFDRQVSSMVTTKAGGRFQSREKLQDIEHRLAQIRDSKVANKTIHHLKRHLIGDFQINKIVFTENGMLFIPV